MDNTTENIIEELKALIFAQDNRIQSLFDNISDRTPATEKTVNKIVELTERTSNDIAQLLEYQQNSSIQESIVENFDELKATIGISSASLSELKAIVRNIQEHNEYFLNAENSDFIKESIANVFDKIDTLNSIALDQASASALEEVRTLIEQLGSGVNFAKDIDNQGLEQRITAVAEQLDAAVEILSINASTGDIEDIKQQLSENNNRIESVIVDNIAELRNSLASLEERLGEFDSEDGVNDINDALRQNMELIKTEIGLFTQKISEIEENLTNNISGSLSGQIGETRDTLLQRSEELSENIVAFQGKIIEIESMLTSTLYETGRLFGHSDEILNTVTALYEIVSNIEGIAQSITSTVDGYEFRIDGFSNKVDDIDVGLIQLNGTIETLNETVQSFSNEYNNLKVNIEFVPEIAQNLSELNEHSAESTKTLSNVYGLLTDAQNSFKNDNELFNNNFNNLRIEFQNISERFTRFHEDVTDISNRTNKLIITSAEDSDTLKQHLTEFKETFEDVKQKTTNGIQDIQNTLNKNFEVPSSEIKNLVNENITISKSNQQSLNNLSPLLQNTEVTKNAIIQIAEWIDGAGRLIEETNATATTISHNTKDAEILGSLHTLSEALNGLNEKIELNGSISYQNTENLRSVIQNLNSSISAISDELGRQVQGQIDQLGNRLEASNQNVLSITGEINNIATALENFDRSFRKELDKISANFEHKLEDSQNLSNKILHALETNLSSTKHEVNKEINRLSNKFETLEERFDRLEERIESLAESKASSKTDEEIRTILEYIAGQVTAGNESGKWKAIVVKKLDNVERRVASFEQSIRKMNQFWDE